jgi:hypothetical protein
MEGRTKAGAEMKIINAQYLEGVIEDILHDKEELAKQKREQFVGVPENEVLAEIGKRLGNNWLLKKTPPHITDEDFKSMASGRFYRGGGIKILGGWMILILALLQLGVWFPFFQPYNYILCGLATVGFVIIYGKKQKEAYQMFRRDLWGEKEISK